ncbi:endo-1,4-beta-xylanase [Leptothermofonsia sichuanensis E412]|uniref:endo-1,4-beta-xylanase n=1 Tax=Leptothermofonsia sichuanensis TaxID=2917832 RepID=UPI001CA6EF44|nr:endo-1,4-beta-xylanase [Leptothermofonsia sichuanensis]QZZ21050.1 endo-1,4-beta-xylanase [Leptothermofonsia sichuanensis E412]
MRQWLVLGLLAIASGLIHWLCSGGAQTMAATTSATKLDASIRRLRTGDLVIRVVDSQQQPVAGATVTLEQTAHDFDFGTALSTQMFRPNVAAHEQAQYLQIAKQWFNASVHEDALKWYSTEPEQGQVSYADADRILAWSEANGLKMRGHTLFWAVEKWNQPWVRALSPQELRQAVERRTTEICHRYRGKISEYDVLNELLHGDFYQQRLGEGIVDQIFQWCRDADPTARLYVNDYDVLNGKLLDAYVHQIRSLLDRGVPVGGIGVQAHVREPMTAAQIQHCLDTLAQFRLPIKITELGVVAATEAEQARILKDLYTVAFAHPAVTGILMWGFWAGANWEPAAAIFKHNFEPTLAARTYQDLVFNQWWTKVNGKTNSSGVVAAQAFFGRYQVTVRAGNHSTIRTVSLTPQSPMPQVVTITLPF